MITVQPPKVRPVAQYKLMLENVPAHTAAGWLLTELRGYHLYGSNRPHRDEDTMRIRNFLIAWLLTHQDRDPPNLA